MNRSPTRLRVKGMSCSSCVRHVRDALRNVPGVEEVDVSLPSGEVLVRHDGDTPPLEQMLQALASAGYPAEVAPR